MIRISFYLIFFCLFSFSLLQAQEEKSDEMALLKKNPEEAYKKSIIKYKTHSFSSKEELNLLYNIAFSAYYTKRNFETIYYGNLAVEKAKEENDIVKQLKLLNNMGSIFQSFRVNEKTKYYLEEADEILKKNVLPDSLNYIKGNFNYLKAINYAYSLDTEMAVAFLNQAIKIYESSKFPLARFNIRIAYINRGFSLLDMGQLDLAHESFKLAQVENIANPEVSSVYPVSFIALQNIYSDFGLATIIAKEKKYSESNAMLKKIIKNPDFYKYAIDTQADVYLQMAENYMDLDNSSQNLIFFQKYKETTQQTEKKQSDLINQYLANESDFYNEKSQKSSQRFIIFSLAIGSILLLISFFLVKRMQVKNDINKKLIEKILNV